MNAAVSPFLGVMGSLIWKLGELLMESSKDDPKGWPRLPERVKDGFALLKEDLEEIKTYLENLLELEDPPLTVKCWMKEVRELSYDIEDYIDCFVRPNCRTNIKTRSLCNLSHGLLIRLPKKKKLPWHKQVSIKISEFRIRAHEVNERHKRYDLDCLDFRRRYAPSGPMLPRRLDEAADLVIDGQMSGFMDTLACDGDHQLKVLSIVGSGGLGKTTFARVLYNKIAGQFDCRAFVWMTRKPNIKKILHDILRQVQGQQALHNCEDFDITSRIRRHLYGKRYLIVIDDLWATSTWSIISRAFPEGSQRSRIILTTQVEDVALMCCCYQQELLFELKPMDVYHSRKLFFDRIFGSEIDCPEIFKEISNKIVDMCCGSPLATANMASLLASHSVLLMEQWTHLSDSLSTMLKRSSTSDGMRQVLNLSYNNLSHYLKSCLLYLNMYPECCIICKEDLVKQWVAEGFINAAEGRDMESIARSYFDELIDRRFIQPSYIKYNDEIVSCTVHDTVHDLIAYNSAEENFVIVVDTDRKNVELCDKVHRLFLNFGDAMYAKKPRNIGSSHIRSLAFSGYFTCMPSITEFKHLRVLNLQLSGHHGDGDILDLSGVSELFHLRYLKVTSDVCIELPKHIQGLQNLETLDMDTRVTAVPWDIIHLPCLLHLHLPFETNLMDWVSRMGSNVVRRIDKLTNLLGLRLTCTTPLPGHLEKNMEALGSLLGGLVNLKTLALVPGLSYENTVVRGPPETIISWDGFSPPLHLQRLELSLCFCTFSRVPTWIGEFANLFILKIVVKELRMDGVNLLKRLPFLTALSLYVHASPIQRIIFDKEGFSSLKYMKLRCSILWLLFQADAMPNLLKLKLGFNAHGVDQHGRTCISIEHIYSLKEISVKIGGACTNAESAFTADIINHPKNPQITISLVDQMLYGDEGRSTAVKERELERIKQQGGLLAETKGDNSKEDGTKQAIIRIGAPPVSFSHLPALAQNSKYFHSIPVTISGDRPSCLHQPADIQVKQKELENLILGYEWDITSDSPESPLNTNVMLSDNLTKLQGINTGDLRQVIIACGKAVGENDVSVIEILFSELRKLVSISGDPMQRLGAYMLEGLVARLSSSGSMIYKSLKCTQTTSSELNDMCPLFKFGYMSANGAIAEAIKGENFVHIIDFKIGQGRQWITLIQALAASPRRPRSIRITGIDNLNSADACENGLDIVGMRLYNVAQSFDLPFQFNAVLAASHDFEFEHLDIRPGEVIAVNFACQLHCVPDESVSMENHRDRIIRMIRSVNPRVVTLVEQQANTNTAPFFQRYMETFDYYTAMLESIDVARPRDDRMRISIEQHCVARDIVNLIACEGAERVERHELHEKWKLRFRMAGFRPHPLSSLVSRTISNLLQSYSSCYRLEERDGALYLGWKNRILVVSSAWCCSSSDVSNESAISSPITTHFDPSTLIPEHMGGSSGTTAEASSRACVPLALDQSYQAPPLSGTNQGILTPFGTRIQGRRRRERNKKDERLEVEEYQQIKIPHEDVEHVLSIP